MKYRVTAEHGTRRWLLRCVEHPGAISEVAQLSQAQENMREAIAFVAQVPEDEIEIQLDVVLPPDVAAALEERRRKVEAARQADHAAAELWRNAAVRLREDGYSMRDIGAVLGVSHQRAHQLVSG